MAEFAHLPEMGAEMSVFWDALLAVSQAGDTRKVQRWQGTAEFTV